MLAIRTNSPAWRRVALELRNLNLDFAYMCILSPFLPCCRETVSRLFNFAATRYASAAEKKTSTATTQGVPTRFPLRARDSLLFLLCSPRIAGGREAYPHDGRPPLVPPHLLPSLRSLPLPRPSFVSTLQFFSVSRRWLTRALILWDHIRIALWENPNYASFSFPRLFVFPVFLRPLSRIDSRRFT